MGFFSGVLIELKDSNDLHAAHRHVFFGSEEFE